MPKGKYERKPYMKSYSPEKDGLIRFMLEQGIPWSKITETLKVSHSRVGPIAKILKEERARGTSIYGNLVQK